MERFRVHKMAMVWGFGFFVVARGLAADEFVAPQQEAPTGLALPTNAVVRAHATAPGFPVFPTPNSPALSASFQALDDNGAAIPPDTMGAVGPNHVMTMLNSQVRIQNRTGTTNYSTVSLSNFWGSVGGFSRAFDPRIVYEPYNQRWIATAGTDPALGSSSILIGVSQTSDPTGSWYKHRIDVDANNAAWADYPTLGFNKNWIVVQVNLFNISGGSFARSHVYVFNKTNVYAGGTNRTLLSLTNYASHHIPAVMYDNTATTMYLVQTWNSDLNNNGYLRLTPLPDRSVLRSSHLQTTFPRLNLGPFGWQTLILRLKPTLL